MEWVGYLFSKTQGKSAFLSVSASEQKILKIWASNSKNSQRCDDMKMTNAKTDFFAKKLGPRGVTYLTLHLNLKTIPPPHDLSNFDRYLTKK